MGHIRMTDEELMVHFRDTGDEGAFEALHTRYAERIASYIGRYIDDMESARDLAQEAFMRIAWSKASYEVRARFSTWAYRIATNLAINAYKSAKRRGCVSLNSLAGPGWSAPDADESVELVDTIADGPGRAAFDDIIAEQTAKDVQTAIDGLPHLQRETFQAVVLEGMTYADAAARLDCTVGTAKSRVHNARRSIRRMVDREATR